ncbi:MAG: tetratricopeptide repeat protein [Ignavibacteria bacterium]|nr:tetratricopeptide repeat protein [Ignavibacteria bacterium]
MFGLFYHFRKDWRLALIFLFMFLMMGVITALYQNQQEPQPRERDYFYVGAFMAFSLWIGVGVAGLGEIIKEKMSKVSMMAIASIVVILSFAFVPLNMLREGYHYQNRNGNYFPYDYAYNILQSLEKDAIVITNGDNDTFPLWCLQAVYGIRTDVRIINLSLAQTDWYNLQLKNERPYGALTVPMTLSDAQLKKLQPVQWDEKKAVTFDVPLTAYPDSMRNLPGLPTKITVNVPPTIRQQSQNQVITAVKANDLLLIDIIKANKWERPIYFSITVSEDNFVGLGDYLVMEGMAQRLVPYKVTASGSDGVNVDIMRKSIFDNPTVASKTPQYGFRFTGLNNPNLFYNEDQTRMAQTYRTVFMRLAYSYSSDSTKTKLAEEVLDKMEKDIPRSVIEMDYRIEYDIAMLYYRLGNMAKFEEYSSNIEMRAEEEISKNPSNVQSYYNPYRILLDVYETKGEYQKALDLLNKLSVMSPGDASVKQKMESIRQKMSNPPGR